MSPTVEQRLQRLEDELALRNLLARYSFTADLNQQRGYADLYTDDGVLDLRDMGMPRFETKASIHDDFITQPAAMAAAGRTFHHQAPTVFHIDGDAATGEGYSYVLYADGDGAISVAGGTNNRWTFRRENGEWKIAHRVVKVLGSPEAADIFITSLG